MGRKWNDMIAHYNIYFNGEQKLIAAMDRLETGNIDDFSSFISVFPWGDDNAKKANTAEMDEVIKKTSTVIQDRYNSKWVDDSYLLMGKAYFFKGDYYAAAETFSYMLARFKKTPIADDANVWSFMCYVMLKRYDDAGVIYSEIKNVTSLDKTVNEYKHAAAAETFIKQNKLPLAKEELKLALQYSSRKVFKLRYHYLLAQLYMQSDSLEKARYHLGKLLKMNPKYDMDFNARIFLARTYKNSDKDGIKKANRYLKKMLKDDKNTSNFDQIYFEMALLAAANKDIPQAMQYYRKSLDNANGKKNLQAMAYLELAKIYFAKPDYLLAQAYYDSTANFIQPDHPDYKKIIDRQTILSDLVKSFLTIQREDSLMKLAKMPADELSALIDKTIENKKEQERLQKQKEEDEKRRQEALGQTQLPPSNVPSLPGDPFSGGAAFYFDNPANIQRGMSEFRQKWGNRALTDYWRYSAKEKETPQPETGGNPDGGGKKDEPKNENPQTDQKWKDLPEEKQNYYRDIPFSKSEQEQSLARVEDAMYKIGSIYYEQLRDYPEAASAFEKYLQRFNGNNREPQVLYNLVKIYEELKSAKKEEAKNKLLTNYPDNSFTLLLSGKRINNNEDINIGGIDKKLLDFYDSMFAAFNQGKYNEVIQFKKTADTRFGANPISGKIMFLYGVSLGKLGKSNEMKEVLNEIIQSYPNTDLAANSEILIKGLEKDKTSQVQKIDYSMYSFNPTDRHIYIMVLPSGKVDINKIKSTLSNFNKERRQFDQLEISSIILDKERILVIVKDFRIKDDAILYRAEFNSAKEFHATAGLTEFTAMVISNKNFVELIKSKNFEAYSAFYADFYEK